MYPIINLHITLQNYIIERKYQLIQSYYLHLSRNPIHSYISIFHTSSLLIMDFYKFLSVFFRISLLQNLYYFSNSLLRSYQSNLFTYYTNSYTNTYIREITSIIYFFSLYIYYMIYKIGIPLYLLTKRIYHPPQKNTFNTNTFNTNTFNTNTFNTNSSHHFNPILLTFF